MSQLQFSRHQWLCQNILHELLLVSFEMLAPASWLHPWSTVVGWVQTAASWYLQTNPLWKATESAAGWRVRKALPWPFSGWDYAAYFSLAPRSNCDLNKQGRGGPRRVILWTRKMTSLRRAVWLPSWAHPPGSWRQKKGDGGWVDVSLQLELLSPRKSQVASPACSLVCSRRNPGFHGPKLR